MSVIPIPEPLKGITSFIQRADDDKGILLPTFSALHTGNFYAAKLAIEANAKDNDSQMYMLNLLDGLEREKAKIGSHDALTNDVVGYSHVENFALKIFVSADNEDRAGKASKKTAKSFLAAATFLEVLKVFGPIDEAVQEKIRYGRFKAVDILKALKEGSVPIPGPPGGEPASDELSASLGPAAAFAPGPAPTGFSDLDPLSQALHPGPPPALFDFSSAPAPPTPHQQQPPSSNPSQPFFDAAPPSQPTQPTPSHSSFPTIPTSYPSAPAPASSPASSQYVAPPPSAPVFTPVPQQHQQPTQQYRQQPPTQYYNAPPLQQQQPLQIDHTIVTAATKNCKFAMSALQYEDVNTALDQLEKAIALLRPYKK
ncbi:UNVERIFIED_CONTAM: hypothetical protein HDU68_002003 [Siphonaria sp. JEL0065]|nr:hypothetical protein HDU68_002003 [Siphonaria sp. JEL0065]